MNARDVVGWRGVVVDGGLVDGGVDDSGRLVMEGVLVVGEIVGNGLGL